MGPISISFSYISTTSLRAKLSPLIIFVICSLEDVLLDFLYQIRVYTRSLFAHFPKVCQMDQGESEGVAESGKDLNLKIRQM